MVWHVIWSATSSVFEILKFANIFLLFRYIRSQNQALNIVLHCLPKNAENKHSLLEL